jgi:glutathione-regulated potassium-efflux system ancillary protein KefG
MKILVLFAHPRLSSSLVQRAMIAAIGGLEGVTIRDLYAEYPHFAIDVAHEQRLLTDHDLIVFQHPLYWYSCPAIVKEWLDLVLEIGWAYGPGGDRLHRKFMMAAVSTGGTESAYQASGRNRFPVCQLLLPFDQSAHLCGMGWLAPFVVYEGRRLSKEALHAQCASYRDLITGLRDERIDPLTRLAPNYTLPPAFLAGAA